MTPDFSCASWRKSRHSQQMHDQCVEVAAVHGYMGVRDSKDPAGPMLIFTSADWRAFTRAINGGPNG
ncbi:DUF397 domain-containing protein [Actinomadura algeriensis]|nr:DUF397 domain-containing protein [Actinomadura algeriensis]